MTDMTIPYFKLFMIFAFNLMNAAN